MAFWTAEKWRELPQTNEPVRPFDQNRLEDANYLLSVGKEIYLSSSEKKNTIRRLVDGESFSIDPGQFAYILTEEAVSIPFNAIGFISIRASVKFSGLVNISGFHVDPGYQGNLIFSVFNAGPTTIHLKRGEQVFPLWLADLDQRIKRATPKIGYDSIPAKLISAISGNYTTAFEVNESLRKAKDEIDKLRNDIIDLKSFKTQMYVVFGILVLIFGPTIKDRVVGLLPPTSPSEVYNSALPQRPSQSAVPDPQTPQLSK
ncbi:dCTP deaminase [Rhizobium leguminosarum]|uniref:dCTP deaminase domain-containing protein n=1 Tax=Rhizobium leguminosarum TaxID=384 RepID=UPI0016167AF0|nr:deoxycytidine triphosphate deaminase [Rhizobium leguminosarum]MBB5666172.1 dCTP deaminase [Rhizobium leguminosarum]